MYTLWWKFATLAYNILIALRTLTNVLLYTRPLVSAPIKNRFCFSTFSTFHKFLNQYQACLYLFECMTHGYSKLSHQNFRMLVIFLKMLWFCFFPGRLLSATAWKVLIRQKEQVLTSLCVCFCELIALERLERVRKNVAMSVGGMCENSLVRVLRFYLNPTAYRKYASVQL